MDALKAEIAKKRQKLQALSDLQPDKKYFRRSEEWLTVKGNVNKNDVRESNNPPANESEIKTGEHEKWLENAEGDVELKPGQIREIFKRLRERSAPIRLFGESDVDVFKRLRKMESESPDIDNGFKTSGTLSFVGIDDAILGAQQADNAYDVELENSLFTHNEIVEMSKKLEKDDYSGECELVYSFFNFILYKWGLELNQRSVEVKRSATGKKMSAIHRQTSEYLQPLFKALSLKSLNGDILDHLVSIAQSLLGNDYIQANNRYMQMAIGNAPWPVGVTASGIHKRPGSEKLYVRNVAHVLNDEVQRKYIQALKRLMTRCQAYYPTDPSRSVEYVQSHD